MSGVTVWRSALEGVDPAAAARRIRDAGLEIVALCRGGFFPSTERAKRRVAVEENLRAVDEAAALGAPLLVLVCGSDPSQSLAISRAQIREGIEAILPHAATRRVKLAVEPLHPMYADTRSAINTLRQANDLCAAIGSPWVGVAVDMYHVWWDPDLENEIRRSGGMEKLFAFHVCDWKTPKDILNDRALMGEGCIPIRQIRGWVEAAGFEGYHEVEVFSTRWWAEDQGTFLRAIKRAYLDHV